MVYPYAPCMEYLPTIYHTFKPNVGKYTIHGASGIFTYMERLDLYGFFMQVNGFMETFMEPGGDFSPPQHPVGGFKYTPRDLRKMTHPISHELAQSYLSYQVLMRKSMVLHVPQNTPTKQGRCSIELPNEPTKKPSYFPLYWLVNRDPYSGLL